MWFCECVFCFVLFCFSFLLCLHTFVFCLCHFTADVAICLCAKWCDNYNYGDSHWEILWWNKATRILYFTFSWLECLHLIAFNITVNPELKLIHLRENNPRSILSKLKRHISLEHLQKFEIHFKRDLNKFIEKKDSLIVCICCKTRSTQCLCSIIWNHIITNIIVSKTKYIHFKYS